MSNFDEEAYCEKISKMLYDLVRDKHMKDSELLLFTNKIIKATYEIAISKKDIFSANKLNEIYKKLNNGNNIEENIELMEMLNENRAEVIDDIRKSA